MGRKTDFNTDDKTMIRPDLPILIARALRLVKQADLQKKKQINRIFIIPFISLFFIDK